MAVAGALLGFFVGGYKRILLRATAHPVWRSTAWLGPLLLTSAATSGVAAIILVNFMQGNAAGAAGAGVARALEFTWTLQALLLGL